MNPDTAQKYLSLKQTAIYLGLSQKVLYLWKEEGKMPAYKLGRVWRFDKTAIDQWVRSNRESKKI